MYVFDRIKNDKFIAVQMKTQSIHKKVINNSQDLRIYE